MENAKVEPTQADAPSKYYKICGNPIPTPAFIRDAYGFQWLHFGVRRGVPGILLILHF